MNTRLMATTALVLLTLSGCATIFGDKNDQVTIRSNEPDAKIIVNGNEVGRGTAVYTMPRGKTAIITASKDGCSDRSISTEESFVGLTWINILFWPGFIVDAATGAIYKTDPANYTVTPDCKHHS